jgi:hypothetical protein
VTPSLLFPPHKTHWYVPCSADCIMKTSTGNPSADTPLAVLPARALRAHELKSCRHIVKAVNKLVESELSETSRQRIERWEAAVTRMVGLIAEVLLVEGGEAPAVFAFVSANDVVRAAIARVEDVAEHLAHFDSE